MALLRRAHHAGDGCREPIPVGALLLELPAPEARQRIEARVAAGVGRRPRRAEPAALLEAMQRRIERPLLHLHDVAGHLLQPPRDRVAVDRTERDDFQDQHVERALQEVGFRAVCRHTKTLYTSICRTSRCGGRLSRETFRGPLSYHSKALRRPAAQRHLRGGASMMMKTV